MKIWEYDLRLYQLLRICLRGDYVSPARDRLRPKIRAGMLRTLRTTQVAKLDGCGTPSCHSFVTLAPPKNVDELFTVRFHVSGELQVTCDADGIIYRIQYLRDETANPSAEKCYALTEIGWVQRDVAEG